jgi:hypothetical protein
MLLKKKQWFQAFILYSNKVKISFRIVMKLCLEMASGGLGGRVVYVASLNTTTVDHQSITSMVTV